MLNSLYNLNQPVWRYVLRAWLIAFIPSVAIATGLSLLGGNGAGEKITEGQSAVGFAVGAMLISPWVETLMMWPLLAFYRRILQRFGAGAVVLASALTWAAVHSLVTPTWGVAVFWPFLVFSIAFMQWAKQSRFKAIVVTALIHTCQNLVPALVFLMAGQ